MGWCYEFGPQIGDGCDHPMSAGDGACVCSECGAVCHGRFAGCAAVWAAHASAATGLRPRRPREPVPRVVVAAAAPDAVDVIDVLPRQEEADSASAPSEDVLGWFQQAFDRLHAELRALGATVGNQRITLEPNVMGSVDTAAIAADLTEQVGAWLDTRPGVAPEIEVEAADLRRSVDEVRNLTDQLRVEMARLAAFRRALADKNPAVAALVDESATRAEERARSGGLTA